MDYTERVTLRIQTKHRTAHYKNPQINMNSKASTH